MVQVTQPYLHYMNRTFQSRPERPEPVGKPLQKRRRAPLQLRKAWILVEPGEAKAQA